MNLRQAIQQAVKSNDLNVAVRGIQDVLGQTAGDIAGQMFSGVSDGDPFNEDYWPHASPRERLPAIMKYVESELTDLKSEFGMTEETEPDVYEAFDPYTDPETRRMLERAGVATHRHRR